MYTAYNCTNAWGCAWKTVTPIGLMIDGPVILPNRACVEEDSETNTSISTCKDVNKNFLTPFIIIILA